MVGKLDAHSSMRGYTDSTVVTEKHQVGPRVGVVDVSGFPKPVVGSFYL